MIPIPISIQDPKMRAIIDALSNNGMGVQHTDLVPTKVEPGKMMVYDNGAGTKRIYLTTAKGNLSYLTLT
jgi:hypothetical protein